MLTILPAPDHVAAYRLMQTLTGEDVDAIMAELNDYDRYHIRQKLNGGRLKINVQRSTEPGEDRLPPGPQPCPAGDD